MSVDRFVAAFVGGFLFVLATLGSATASEQGRPTPGAVIRTWYELVLELVRHTPTYSPPVASRSFGYLGVTAYEAVAGGSEGLATLAGQLNGLSPVPQRAPGERYDDAVVLEAALAAATRHHFSNTGPTGQRAMAMIAGELDDAVAAGLDPDVVERSRAYGLAVADHVFRWAADDGGAVVENMGFPYEYALSKEPGHWVPTSLVAQQQLPLLPGWGDNRPFAMPEGASCDLPPPPAYSEDKASAFYAGAVEVYEIGRSLTPEQRTIARFWADDPMLSKTPPGHWIAIAMQLLDEEQADAARSAEVLARLGIVLADAFIGCWHTKYEYDLVRPVTYIRRLIDPKWEPIMTTPPFPEYPSGHSTQSAAAALVLADLFGAERPFRDTSHEDDGFDARDYPNFWAAAKEAALSRLYGGIHFRAAIEGGLDQGRCIAAYTNALTTRRR